MSKSLKDLAYLVSSNALLKVMGIVSVMVYTRFLLKEELALVPIFTVMGRLSMVVFSFGILQTLVRDIPHLVKEKNTETANTAILTSLMIIIPGIFVFSVLCYLCSGYLSAYFLQSNSYQGLLKLMSIGFFFTGINQTFSYIYWSLSRFQQESNRVVLVGLVQIILGIASVFIWGIIGLIISLIISSIVNTAIFIYNLKDILFTSSFKIYPVRELIIESMPFYMESYLQYFRAEGDQLLVAGLLGPQALAIYFIARKPYDFLHSFTLSLDKVLTTSLAKFKNDPEMFNKKVNSIITLNSYILFPIIFFTIGISPTFVILIAGKGYGDAVFPSILLLLWLLAQVSWKTALGKSIFILKSSTGRFKVTLVETITLLGLMLLLGRYFDLNGIVTGRFLATLLAGFYAFYLIKNNITLNIDKKSIATITTHSIIMCLLLLLVQYISSNYIILFFSLIFVILLFLILINRTVSDKYYSVVNSVAPIKIIDPLKYMYHKMRTIKA